MSNKSKGIRKEREIATEYNSGFRPKVALKLLGRFAQRAAGSHSDVDVFCIDIRKREIELVQAKPDSMSKAARKKIVDDLIGLNGLFKVVFKVV